MNNEMKFPNVINEGVMSGGNREVATEQSIQDLTEGLADVAKILPINLLNKANVTFGKYIDDNGVEQSTASTTYHTELISCVAGQKITFFKLLTVTGVFVDSHGVVVEKIRESATGSNYTATVPPGAVGVYWNGDVNTPPWKTMIIDGEEYPNIYVNYGETDVYYQNLYKPNVEESVVWAIVGDSNTEENSRASKRFYDFISEKYGYTIENYGVSGTGYHRIGDGAEVYNTIPNIPLNINKLSVNSIINDYFEDAVPLGTISDTTNTTISGCIYLAFEAIINRFPVGVEVSIFTGTPRTDCHPLNEVANTQGWTMGEMADRIIEFCKLYNFKYKDTYRECGFHQNNATFVATVMADEVHFNDVGHEILYPDYEKVVV